MWDKAENRCTMYNPLHYVHTHNTATSTDDLTPYPFVPFVPFVPFCVSHPFASRPSTP